MKKYFTITLKSDLCCSDGSSFGSLIDRDIAADEFGLPYISGKSLKGLFRECAEEYECICGENFADRLFGKDGTDSGSVTIHNAHPTNYEELIADIRDNKLPYEFVRSIYTYTRGQTAINDDGTAEKGTLRMIAVLKRGQVFLCEYDAGEKDSEEFEKLFPLLRHIGVNRTRGLGEIKCEAVDSLLVKSEIPGKEKITNEDISDECKDIELIINTRSPLITEFSTSGEYIPSSKIAGLFISRFGRNEFIDMIDRGMQISNAYISDGNKRFYPSPAYLARTKEEQFKDDKMQLYIFDTDSCDKYAMGYKNSATSRNGNDLETISVSSERSYHHRQSDDNPGVVDSDNFYTLSGTSSFQVFMARISSKNADDIKRIADTIQKDHYASMGFYKTSGFGDVFVDVKEHKFDKKISSDEIAVYLHSPVVIYDENGMPCTKPEVFDEYFKIYLKEKYGYNGDLETLHRYLRYSDITGYNHTWSKCISSFECLGGGTVMVYKLDKALAFGDIDFMGERCAEGHGEFEILNYKDVIKTQPALIKIKKENISVNTFYPTYTDRSTHWAVPSVVRTEREREENCIRSAFEQADKKCASVNAATVGRLLRMLNESCGNYDEFERRIKDIKDKEKQKKVNVLLKLPDNITGADYMLYYKTFLIQIKYQLRRQGE